ncbi:MAG: class I SAM-dependent methyltransferase [Promethearchaeota archaeon]
MTPQNKSWVEEYQNVVAKWELEPDWALIKYHQLISQGPVLDLGMGNGRNALFFAKLGHDVDCVDVSKTWVKKCQNRAKDENLRLTAYRADIRSFKIPKRYYSLIIASKILQFFIKSDIEVLVEKMYHGLARRGVLYLRVFSIEEFEYYLKHKREITLVEPNTYYVPKYQLYYHFYTKEEILSLFSKLRIIHCVEGLESDLRFKKPRKQWVIDFLGQRIR